VSARRDEENIQPTVDRRAADQRLTLCRIRPLATDVESTVCRIVVSERKRSSTVTLAHLARLLRPAMERYLAAACGPRNESIATSGSLGV